MTKTRLQIFGQRCSGTNFLEQLLWSNFQNIKLVSKFGFKHAWKAQIAKKISKSPETKIIIIIRNPFDWLRSLHREPHHCPDLYGLTFSTFLKHSVEAFVGPEWNDPLKANRDKVKQNEQLEHFSNVIEMRNLKNKLFLNISSQFEDQVIVINYEKLRDKSDITLDEIATKFGLKRLKEYKGVTTYKKTGDVYKAKSLPRISRSDLKFIRESIDWETEAFYGYSKDDYEYDSIWNFNSTKQTIKEFYAQAKGKVVNKNSEK